MIAGGLLLRLTCLWNPVAIYIYKLNGSEQCRALVPQSTWQVLELRCDLMCSARACTIPSAPFLVSIYHQSMRINTIFWTQLIGPWRLLSAVPEVLIFLSQSCISGMVSLYLPLSPSDFDIAERKVLCRVPSEDGLVSMSNKTQPRAHMSSMDCSRKLSLCSSLIRSSSGGRYLHHGLW